jgi:hypothetical protein
MNRANNVKRSVPGPAGQRGSGPPRPAAAAPPVKKHRNHPLCRTSEYKPPGSDKVGLSSSNQPSKVVWELDYGLSEVQFKQLSARFPGVAFVQTGMDCHDHPIAHTSYRIVWENVTRKLQPGWRVADVAGNPSFNERFNKRQNGRDRPVHIDTFCKVLSTKDSIRAKTRWGPASVDGVTRWEEMTVYDMYRNDENRQRFAQYDAFLMNHSLYYYEKSEINRLLNLNKNSVLFATVHKLEGQNGTINCGEQRYEKDLVTGKVVQVNVETGEEYRHPDPMPWFQKFCYADENGAIAWTINKGCDDTYVITVTSTEVNLVPEDCWLGGRIIFSNGVETVEVTVPTVASDPPPAYSVEEVKFTTHDLLPSYSAAKEVTVKITHPELYDSLKKWMINKPRNARTLQDLTAKAHREAGNNTLVGTSKRIAISSEALTKHIFAAWMAGTGCEAEMFEAAVSAGSYAGAVNRNLSGRTTVISHGNVGKQMLQYALKVSAVVRSKSPAHEVLAQIDELL